MSVRRSKQMSQRKNLGKTEVKRVGRKMKELYPGADQEVRSPSTQLLWELMKFPSQQPPGLQKLGSLLCTVFLLFVSSPPTKVGHTYGICFSKPTTIPPPNVHPLSQMVISCFQQINSSLLNIWGYSYIGITLTLIYQRS